ncbi:MAG TPA: threo-3-hydroxy-L-aspartate ammonia-lyase [Burkholderiales bacterium]|nr:threo-3-hydroxy-L-aspartate ammonia-lyase [Burkholderiales bacterium]
MVTFADIESAHERLRPHARRTPVLNSATVDELTGAKVYFKCENFQRMGAFKFRGAYNALSRLAPEESRRGVIAFSSGNHAQAVALAGKLLGIQTLIVMPWDAPKVKLAATRGYGAQVVIYKKGEDREQVAARHAGGRILIPPFNHPHIVAGQGTAAKELIEDVGHLDMLLVPCGGGGLLSGSAVAARHLLPKVQVVGVEPRAGDDATRSFRKKKIVKIEVPKTIADGARTQALGSVTFPLVMAHVSDMLTVTDEQLLQAMFFMWERMKVLIEPTGALAACAVLQKKKKLKGLKVGVILSGGNVDLRWAATQMHKYKDSGAQQRRR